MMAMNPVRLEEARTGPYRVASLRLAEDTDPVSGTVAWDPARSLWNGGMMLAAVLLGPLYFSWGAGAVFTGLLALTMCTGHSVGFHRRLIHRTFQCSKLLERVLVWSGTLRAARASRRSVRAPQQSMDRLDAGYGAGICVEPTAWRPRYLVPRQ